jgi:hypothetical protein
LNIALVTHRWPRIIVWLSISCGLRHLKT